MDWGFVAPRSQIAADMLPGRASPQAILGATKHQPIARHHTSSRGIITQRRRVATGTERGHLGRGLQLSSSKCDEYPPAGTAAKAQAPGAVEEPWSELASSRRALLPLLGERAGVRAGISIHPNSTPRSIERAGSGVLRLQRAKRFGAQDAAASS